MAGSQFNISATVNISEIVDVQSLDLTWWNGNESVVNTTWSGQSETNSSGPVVSTLDLVFNTLLLSQAGVYTLQVTISDSELNNVTLPRTYELIVQSKCRFGKCLTILVFHSLAEC